MARFKKYVMITSNSPVWGIDTEYITNWEEGEKLHKLKTGMYGELGRSGLFQVYKGTGIMKYADNAEEAKILSKQFKAEEKAFMKMEKEYLSHIRKRKV